MAGDRGILRELSLFSGAGGGLFGSKLLGWETIGYVEFNKYCQQVIAARIKDGILDEVPIFGDIRAFISDGYAASYTGLVDVLTGGFPCQPFSVAGKQAAADDPRNMWPETLEVIRIVRPRYAFLENVPGLLSRSHRYFETILKDLAESGYDVKWKVISAAEVGAPHKRDRLWIVAYPNTRSGKTGSECSRREAGSDINKCAAPTGFMANAEKSDDRISNTKSSKGQIQQLGKRCCSPNVSDPNVPGLEEWEAQDSEGARSKYRARTFGGG